MHASLKANRHIATAALIAALAFREWSVRGADANPTIVLKDTPTFQKEETMSRESLAAQLSSEAIHAMILQIIDGMPKGGMYHTSAEAMLSLRRAVQSRDSALSVECGQAVPSFCSSATYLVFVSAIERLSRAGRVSLDPGTLSALLVANGQADGQGIWGRWNSNGPGTARLFFEAQLGRNFTSLEEAQPGDFLKIFWNDAIGSRESGHSVIYLGTDMKADGGYVRYWSSNQPNGYGEAEVPLKRVHRTLFSRFEHPESINRLGALPPRDAYLAAMLRRPSTEREMLQTVGLSASAGSSSPATGRNSPVEGPDALTLPLLTPKPAPPPSAKKKTLSPAPSLSPSPPPTPHKTFFDKLLGR